MSSNVQLSSAIADARVVGPDEDFVQRIVDRERARAHAAGVAEGRALERAESAARLDEAGAAIAAEAEDARAELAATAVHLAIGITRTLLRTEIAAGNYDLERTVRDVLAQATSGRGACTVHLNPVDCARLAGVPFRNGTVLEPDEGVHAGDVHVETSLGLLVRETFGALRDIEARILEDIS